jgi:starch synthase
MLTKKLKILFVATEAAPFAKAGGLGDIMYSLPLALRKQGQDARIIIPKYGTIDKEGKCKLEDEIRNLKVPTDQPGENPYLICNIKKSFNGETAPVYFLENMEYYEKRANVYGYSDDTIRWALLCRGTIEFIKKSSWIPDIIVASDWQTGLLSNYLRTIYREDKELSKIATIFSVHNLHFQGMCDFKFSKEADKDSGHEPIPDFFNPRLFKLNWMLRGIMYSDTIGTVSPTYAKEIMTPEFGEGLEKLLEERRTDIHGILNGINYDKYNPQTALDLPVHYSSKTIENKIKNKIHLQEHFGLNKSDETFVVGMASRLAEQKGFDLVEKIINEILKNTDLQFIFLGDGESRYKEFIKNAAQDYPKRVGYLFEFDTKLPHLVFAGSDAFLIPSKFEPCGITQMQSMRYGSIPIARKTGGLADTVKEFVPEEEKGNGFVFKEYNPFALFESIIQARTSYNFKESWKKLIKRAMEENFSWEKSAQEYIKVFKKTIKKRK